MPKGRTSSRRGWEQSRNRAANKRKVYTRSKSTYAKRKQTIKQPSSPSGYINRRSNAWRKATGDAINRNK